ncbi:MAG TPA: hypothetical protein VMH20_10280 [Verrucomicrobiae bacterium]|nr:hypothetical protein [Verrucomicrobiae bacterium]
MKTTRSLVIPTVLCVFPLLLSLLLSAGEKKDKFSCSESNPQSICSAATTCGSASTPCRIDIKRSGQADATATPNIPDAKGNTPFCIKVGTHVTFYSSSKDTGFVLDFGPNSPFGNQGAIMGGYDRPITVVAKRPGCFGYSVGACTAGTVYGMCGNSDTELVVSAGK